MGMNDYPLVSIILLTYNHEKYIEDCLLSLLDQNYTNIELILLDDASKDKTADIIQNYLEILHKKFNNIIFIKNDHNIGNIPFNMNQMLRRAKGFYCKMLSGDDILECHCISKLVDCLVSHPQCDVAYANTYLVQENYKKGLYTERTKNAYSYRRSGMESQNFFRNLIFGNAISAPAAIVKRNVFEKYGYLDETITFEDYEYWLRLSFHRVNFYFLNECLVYYRQSNKSASNLKNKAGIKRAMLSDKETLNKYFKYLSEEERKKSKEYYYLKYLKVCWEQKYWRGFWGILYKLQKEKIYVPKKLLKEISEDEYEQICKKNVIVIKMLEKWISNIQEKKDIADYFRINHYKTIAIYGLGCIANRLCDELKNTEIEIKYIIDRNADLLLTDLKLIKPEDDFENVDVLVITPAGLYEDIKRELKKKIVCPIIHIEDIIFWPLY